MGLHSRLENKGRTYFKWVSKARLGATERTETRQRLRAALFMQLWKAISGPRALRDDKGIMPRRVRRSIMRAQAKRVR